MQLRTKTVVLDCVPHLHYLISLNKWLRTQPYKTVPDRHVTKFYMVIFLRNI